MRVRPALASDVRRIVLLWKEMWEFHMRLDARYQVTPLAEAWMEEWVGRCIAEDQSVVLVADGPPLVGYLLGLILQNPPVVPWSQYGHISELSVTASARRKGIGGDLLAAADEWFRRRGYVEANVSAANAVSRAFWSRHGYVDFIERRRKEL
jgi:GNAT superfamily N-acetyltransferase